MWKIVLFTVLILWFLCGIIGCHLMIVKDDQLPKNYKVTWIYIKVLTVRILLGPIMLTLMYRILARRKKSKQKRMTLVHLPEGVV